MQKYKYPKFTGNEPCIDVGIDVFYYMHEDKFSINQAKKDQEVLSSICASCPILNDCREYAIHHEDYGYWGGMTHLDREKYRKKFNITLGMTHAWMTS